MKYMKPSDVCKMIAEGIIDEYVIRGDQPSLRRARSIYGAYKQSPIKVQSRSYSAISEDRETVTHFLVISEGDAGEVSNDTDSE